jgi:putative SOS response-associated peptidase YedK
MKSIHDRMPSDTSPECYRRWLDPAEVDAASLLPLLAPYTAEEMDARPVSKVVNNPRNDSPECIKGITEPG